MEHFRVRNLTLQSDRTRLGAEGTSSLARLLAATPELDLSLGRYQDKLNAIPSPTTGITSYNATYNYWNAEAKWNLFKGGADYFAWRSQKSTEEAQLFQVLGRELQVELDGAKLLFRRLYLQDVQSQQTELLKLKEESLKIGRSRYAHGKIPLQEVVKMEVDLALQQNVVHQGEIDLAENEAAYRSLFVDALETKSWPFTENQGVSFTAGAGSFETKRLQSHSKALDLNLSSVRGAYFPSLDFDINYKQYPLPNHNEEWTGTLIFSLPLWSRYQVTSAAAQAHADFVQAENDAAAGARKEELQREFLKKKIALSKSNLIQAMQILEKSDRLYLDELRSFQLGRLSTNDLFQEQNRKIQSHLSYAQSRLSYHESLMEACVLWGLSAHDCLR